MSIKIVNGLAVVVNDDEPTTGTSSVIPRPTTTTAPSKKSAPPATQQPKGRNLQVIGDWLGNLAKSVVPGLGEAWREAKSGENNPLAPNAPLIPPFAYKLPLAIGKDVANLVKGVPGFLRNTVMTPAKSIYEATPRGKPISGQSYDYSQSVDNPVGKWLLKDSRSIQSGQKEYEQMGATNPAVSYGLPVIEELLGLLGSKGILNVGAKGFRKAKTVVGDVGKVPDPVTGEMIKPGTTLSEPAPVEAVPKPGTVLEKGRITSPWTTTEKAKVPVPDEMTKATPDQTQMVLDQLVRPAEVNTGLKQKAKQKVNDLSRLNPYQFESSKIEGFGPAGKELTIRGRRANATQILTAGELKKTIKQTGVAEFTPQEQVNWRASLEGKATPVNERVAQATNQWREIFDKYGKETEVEMLENYFPRGLNETGKNFFSDMKNRDMLVEEVMRQEGMDRVNAIKYVDKSLRRGGFEYGRVLPDLPDEYRMSPIDEVYRWATDVSRRRGIIQEFGKKNEIADNLLAEIGRGEKNEFGMKSQAQEYVNRVMGKDMSYSDLNPLYNFLQQSMVVSKLSPLTTAANELQAHVNSYLDYGVRGLADATLGRGGKQLIKELGLDDIKGKYGDEINPNSMATKWMKGIGMEASETRGITRSAVATKGAIERAFNDLRKDPTNMKAKKVLNDHAMYLDDAQLAKDLIDGRMSAHEMQIGIVEGTRRKMFFSTPGERPPWANAGAGRVAYTFKNYIMNQMKLLAKAPPQRQLAYMMVIAPLTGLPIMVLRKMIQGKPLPEDPADWYIESATAGPGTPFDIARSLNINPVSFGAGGFSPAIDLATSKNKVKSAASNFPLQSLYLNRLFPPK